MAITTTQEKLTQLNEILRYLTSLKAELDSSSYGDYYIDAIVSKLEDLIMVVAKGKK